MAQSHLSKPRQSFADGRQWDGLPGLMMAARQRYTCSGQLWHQDPRESTRNPSRIQLPGSERSEAGRLDPPESEMGGLLEHELRFAFVVALAAAGCGRGRLSAEERSQHTRCGIAFQQCGGQSTDPQKAGYPDYQRRMSGFHRRRIIPF